MNKQSNAYTIIYIVVMVAVVGTLLALTSMALKPRQTANAEADKMKQILAAVHVAPAPGQVAADFDKYITRQLVVNSQGQEVEGKAFDISVEKQSKLADPAERKLPVYECTMPDGAKKYILPVYGAGLWGPIWGYIALDNDGATIFGAYFAHQGETPGLGAEIEKPAFSDQFDSKALFKDGAYVPVEVIKAGQKPADPRADYVDAISGGTITSKGVSDMINNCLSPYEAFLRNISNTK